MKIATQQNEKIRRQVKMRMEWENMKRMVGISLFFAILFSAIWISLLYRQHETISQWVLGIAMFISVMSQIAFGSYGFWWMQQRNRQEAKKITTCYWLATSITFGSCMLLAKTTWEVTFYLFLLILELALIPLLSRRKFLFSVGTQVLLSIVLLIQGSLDVEHWLYTLAVCSLCGIISRQQYSAHLRKFEDGCRLSNVQNQAETDSMTHLLNRRGLERRLTTIWPICERQGMSVAVIMLDIDHFKKYNDAFGHGKGDDCIQAVAEKLIENTPRKSDYAARVGGEEFLIFLSGITQDDAIKWARKCKESIESMQIDQASDNFLPFVTVSMGICHASMKERKEFWELRNEADRCLYLSKENGRASIYIHDSCCGQTVAHGGRRQYYVEKNFRWLG